MMKIVSIQCTSDEKDYCAKRLTDTCEGLLSLKTVLCCHRSMCYSLWMSMKALWHFRYKVFKNLF